MTNMKHDNPRPDPSNGRYPSDTVDDLIERHLSDIRSDEAVASDSDPTT